MSWQSWQMPQALSSSVVPGVMNPAPPVVNPALPVLQGQVAPAMPANMQYSPEQWAQMQQQNWQQWAQWQQQYQQWHQQYGAEYQKSMGGLPVQPPLPAAVPAMDAAPPPLPAEPKPPLPPEDPPAAFNASAAPSYNTPAPPPSYNTMTQQPPPKNAGYTTAPPSGNNWNQNNKRTFNTPGNFDNKRQMTEKWGNQWGNNRPDMTQAPPNFQNKPPSFNQPPPSVAAPKQNPEELSEAEKKFDKEFAAWEAQFNKWKEQNVNHPDKNQYREYEKKWESWRNSLLERREQMRRKRLGLTVNKPPPKVTHDNYTAPPPDMNLNQTQDPKFNKPPPQLNNEPLKFKNPPQTSYPEIDDTAGDDFLKSNTSGGIPGLDLVKDDDPESFKKKDDIIELDREEKRLENLTKNKGPDFEAISKGINTILGDQKILNMLNIVSQPPTTIPNTPLITTLNHISPQEASTSYQEHSSQGFEETSQGNDFYPNNTREGVNNFDDQTRSSFTMGPNDQDMRFDRRPPPISDNNFNRNPDNTFNRNQNKIPSLMSVKTNQQGNNSFTGSFNNRNLDTPANFNRNSENFAGRNADNYSARNSDNFNNRNSDNFNNRNSDSFNNRNSDSFNNRNSDSFNNRNSDNFGRNSFNNFNRNNNFNNQGNNFNNRDYQNDEYYEENEENYEEQDEYQEESYNNEDYNDYNNWEGEEPVNKAPEDPKIVEPEPEPEPIIDDEPVFEPSVVIDYEHKSLKKPVEDIILEPIHMYDYRHKPLNRIPLPQRPPWLSNTVKFIHEFDPLAIPYERSFMPRYDVRRAPPESQNRRGSNRYERPNTSRNYNNRNNNDRQSNNKYSDEKTPSKKDYKGQNNTVDFEELSDEDMNWEEEKPSSNFNEENMSTQNQETTVQMFKSNESKNTPRTNFSQQTVIEDLICNPGRFSRPPKIVIILRGPSGSGKTYLAKLIKDKEVENGGSAPRILSLDDYFMVEQEKEVIEEGKVIKVKEMVYEYEKEMENTYRTSLTKSFKKTITDGYFPFIIVDNVNEKVKYFGEMWSFAKQNGFQVYICQLDLDPQLCATRNIHGRSEREIEDCVAAWEPTPAHHPSVDASGFMQATGGIQEVEMEEVSMEEAPLASKPNDDEVEQNSMASARGSAPPAQWRNTFSSRENRGHRRGHRGRGRRGFVGRT
ncbi:unnamed protein product [Brassicogethes aeneus]|uniref:YLP motif-containing protein 1 n=1 Tax=Brassicogethes aeneus TaxID=1431903 RepID=A0A9P0FKQ4_BRAAE|nr:unnamed protein product [Brassicogethes aeneus]